MDCTVFKELRRVSQSFLISIKTKVRYIYIRLGQPSLQTRSDPRKGKEKVNLLSAQTVVARRGSIRTVAGFKTHPGADSSDR